MLRLRILSIPAALLFAASTASTASAQRWSAGSTSQTARTAPPAAHAQPAAGHRANSGPAAAAASWNGVPSKWGGSPPERRHDGDREQRGFRGQRGAYIPIAVAAPYPVPAAVDTACASAPDASVEMPVVTTHHEERQLTTIEVYRLQPRFQKP
ncbi:MAG: hypothetical protein ACHQSE_09270 [Gemmatimonadales bacterium]